MNENAIQTQLEQTAILKVTGIAEINLTQVRDYMNKMLGFRAILQNSLRKDVDYGIIPGCKRPTMLQPGGQTVKALLRLADTYQVIEKIEDWDKGIFSYTVRCQLRSIDSGDLVSEGISNCNSMETKYRWRESRRKCPSCGKEAIIKGKADYGGGWLCFKKTGGCGAKFADHDEAIASQKAGRVKNEDIYDQVNTLMKMAEKRAMIYAALSAGALSGEYTQDMEDIQPGNHPETTLEEQPQPNGAPKAELPSPGAIKRLTKIKEFILEKGKNEGFISETRTEVTDIEKRKILSAVTQILTGYPKNDADVQKCCQEIKAGDIFELAKPDESREPGADDIPY